MADGRAMFLGKDSQLEPQPVQHLTGSWCLRQQGFRGPRADRSAFQPRQCRANGGAAASNSAFTTSFQQEAVRLPKLRCAAQKTDSSTERRAVRSGVESKGPGKHQVCVLTGTRLGPGTSPTRNRRRHIGATGSRHIMRRLNSNDGQCTRKQAGRGRGRMHREVPAHRPQSGLGSAGLRHLVIALQRHEPMSREN